MPERTAPRRDWNRLPIAVSAASGTPGLTVSISFHVGLRPAEKARAASAGTPGGAIVGSKIWTVQPAPCRLAMRR